MIRSFRRWLSYPPGEKARFAAAAAALVLAETSLKIIPSRFFLRPLTAAHSGPIAGEGTWIVWAERVEKTERHLWSPSCVRRALALSLLAFCAGKRPKLLIGVTKSGPFAAHAWIEINGEVLELPERLVPYETLANGTDRA